MSESRRIYVASSWRKLDRLVVHTDELFDVLGFPAAVRLGSK